MHRRQFIKGLGTVALGLPFLTSLAPRLARAAGSGTTRLVVFFTCNGVAKQAFWPQKTSGALLPADLTGCALEPLAQLSAKLTIPRGISTVPFAYGNCDHARGMTSQLTAVDRDGTFPPGDSVDHVLAAAVNPSARPPLVLGVQANGSGGTGYVSFKNGTPVAPENSPRGAYEYLMGIGGGPVGDPVREQLYTRRRSILDLVARGEFNELFGKRLSQTDHQKLDEHFTLVRSIETQMVETGLASCELPAARAAEIVAENGNYSVIGRMQMDIMAAALACNATRVGVIQWNSGAGGPIFNFDGMTHTLRHHPLSHRSTTDAGTGGNPQAEGQLREIDRWYATQLAYLASRLDGYADGDRTVLDQTVVVWGNELSDGAGHTHDDMPYVLAGSLGGYLKTGEVMTLGRGTDVPHNQLWTTIMNGMGVPTVAFGCGSTCTGSSSSGKSGELAALKA